MKQKIRQKEARRKIDKANAQYEIWKDLDVEAEPDLVVQLRDPLDGLQSKKEISVQAKLFSPVISHAYPCSLSQLIKGGAESKADIIRAPCKVHIALYQYTIQRL